MKTCPICHAVAFDDAEVCYGCLHRFVDGEENALADEKNCDGELPSQFLVSFTPVRVHGETRWDCRVEPVAG